MARYEYRPLDKSQSEIRLLRLHPGSAHQDISLSIIHSPLNLPVREIAGSKLSAKSLSRTVPNGWRVLETFDHDILFADSSWKLSRTHPDVKVERTLYQSVPDYPNPQVEPKYEALSYTWGPPTP